MSTYHETQRNTCPSTLEALAALGRHLRERLYLGGNAAEPLARPKGTYEERRAKALARAPHLTPVPHYIHRAA